MNDPRNRFLLFILGLTVGAMVSGVVVYLSINKEKSALSVSKGMIEEIANKVSVLLSRKNETKEKDRRSEKDFPATASNSDNTTSAESDSADLASTTPSDTIVTDSLHTEEEQIVVRKDELMESRSVEVIELTLDPNTKSRSDSLLEQASGIRSEKRTNGSKIMMTVEFWRSPVNYRGYKLGKNILVLYGLDNSVPISLFKYNGSVFIRHDQSVYKVDAYNDYRAFEKISDPNLLSVFSNS